VGTEPASSDRIKKESKIRLNYLYNKVKISIGHILTACAVLTLIGISVWEYAQHHNDPKQAHLAVIIAASLIVWFAWWRSKTLIAVATREREEEVLKKSVHDWQVTFDTSRDMIILLDPEMNVVKANRSVLNALSLPADEIIGKKCHRLIHGTDSPFQGCPVAKSIETRRRESAELFFPNLGIWAVVTADPIMSMNGHIEGIVHTVHDITARKQLEEELVKAREMQYKTLIESLPGKVFLKDKSSVYVSCNTSYAQDLKIRPEEIAGKTDYDFFPTHLAEKYRADDKRIIESGKTESLEEEFIIVSDYINEAKKAIINTVKVPVRDESGNIMGLFGLFWDITERKQLEDTKSRLFKLISEVSDFIAFADGPTKNVIYINPAGRMMIGLREDEDISKLKIFDTHPEWTNKLFRDEIIPTATRDGSWSGECAFLRRDGREIPVTMVLTAHKSASGEVEQFSTISRDITERKQLEVERNIILKWQNDVNALRQSLLVPAALEAKLNNITNDIVRIFNADFCRIWLIRPGDQCEKGCIHAEVREGQHVCRDRNKCLHLMASSGRYTHIDGRGHSRVPFGCYKIGLIASGEGHKVLTNDVVNDPRVHNHEWARELGLISFAGYHLKVPAGATLGVLALFAKHPIVPAEDAILDGLGVTTAFVVQQEALEEEKRLLLGQKTATEIKSKFASMVSHELRSPMAVIKESINLVLEELVGNVTVEQKDILTTAKNNIDRLGRLINNVLDFQKIEAGRMDLDIKEYDINEMVMASGKEMNLLAEEKGLSFTVNLDESIPSARFDKDKVVQVLTNLLSNAINFTEKGGVSVSTEREDNMVHVIVEDTGLGIQHEDIPKLFQTFEQLGGGLGKKRGGTGLGLAISKEIIQAHNGKIWVESQFGKGSKFHFILPIKERRG